MQLDVSEAGFIITFVFLIAEAFTIVLTRRPIHTVIALFFLVLTVAALFIEVGAVFLAIADLFIYNGGIVVLLTLATSLVPEEIEKHRINLAILFPILSFALLVVLTLSYVSGYVGIASFNDLADVIFAGYGSLFAVLLVTSLAGILSAVYLVSKEDTL